MDPSRVRNFCIIAHVDHGKSTLADRLIEACGGLSERERVDQFLDNMPLERERGITIKAQTVRLAYRANDGETYELNLIDTPGHVDFHYEVSRSLSACEGALLVVDASQGVEAQTLANAYLAIDGGLEIVPVLNKIDLEVADPERVRKEIEEVVGLDASDAILASAKEGKGIAEILEAVVTRMPPPRGQPEAPLRALIFDSWYDAYRGVVVLVRVVDGALRPGLKIRLTAAGKEFQVEDLGVFSPFATPVDGLGAGEVGYVIAGVKDVKDSRVGDTITEAERPAAPLPGFRVIKPMVFAGIFPTEPHAYQQLREAMEKLALNDSSFTFEPETSLALGFGFRCGFLGLLHMEIVQQRLEREYKLELITTAPTVRYRCVTTRGETVEIENPSKLPDPVKIERLEEPMILATIHVPQEHVGAVLGLCQDRRGTQRGISYPGGRRAIIEYEMPLAEVIFDFYDRLKTVTRGYASLDYEFLAYRTADLIRLDLLVNGDSVDALSTIVHRDRSYDRGRDLCRKMRELIPRQMYEVAIQASIGARVIARETVKAMRKDVTAKCYGGDITRKRKLLEKQKEGKRRMKQIGSVEIPQEAFLAVLKLRD
ncbi:MAG: translation elongation factor 4 [Myxococcota bacterium]